MWTVFSAKRRFLHPASSLPITLAASGAQEPFSTRVREVPLREVVDEGPHEGEYLGVVGGGGQDQLPVAECVRDGLGDVAAGQVVDNHLRGSLRLEGVGKLFDCGTGVPVDGCVCDDNALAFNLV